MATIYICDGCKKEVNWANVIQFLGSHSLSRITFCEDCFRPVETYVTKKYKIRKTKKKNAN